MEREASLGADAPLLDSGEEFHEESWGNVIKFPALM